MKKRIAIMGAGVIVAAITVSSLWAEDKPEQKEMKIRELLRLTGAADMGKQMMDGMMDSFRAMPNIQPGFIDRFKKEVNPNEVVELTIPIYDKYLTEEDIDGLITFFKSPTGKKFVSVQPQLIKDSMEIGQKWGQEKAMHVLSLMEQEKK